MSPQPKSAASGQESRSANFYRVAIVGAGSLKGKEVAELLNERNFPALDIKLLDDDESIGQLETVGEEVSFIQSVRAEQFDRLDFTFFASDPDCTRKNWKTTQRAGSAIIDLSYALEDEPEATIRSPWLEREMKQPMLPELQPGPVVTAHPAATALALLILRAQHAGKIQRLVTTIIEPASEHGQKGMDELHEQTVNLLSFQQLPKKVFDTQVAFNMVSRYGEQSLPPLETIEQRISRHYQIISPKDSIVPAMLLVQAPIFHGHAFSIYMDMEQPVALGDLAQALAGEHVAVTRSAEDSPSNVNAAGQGEILVSLARDDNHENGIWIWAAADNLRVSALTAVECAESMAASRPRGTVQ
jgi:aspartate-semialdehyde dehydrogenase